MSDVQQHLQNRAMVVLTADELDRCGVKIDDPKVVFKIKATVAGGILTKHDIERAIKRWISAGCPDPIKYNVTADRMRQNGRNQEEEHIRVCGLLTGSREKERALFDQANNLEEEVSGLESDLKDEKLMVDRLSNFLDLLHHRSLFQRLRIVFSAKYLSKLLKEATNHEMSA